MYHLRGVKTAPFDCLRAVGMGHVQRPQSESSRNDPKFTRARVVAAAHSAGVGGTPADGGAIYKEARKVYHLFDLRVGWGSAGGGARFDRRELGTQKPVRCVSGDDLREGKRRVERTAHLSGFVGGERICGVLPVGEAVRGAAQGEASRAGAADGMPTGRGDAGELRGGRAD